MSARRVSYGSKASAAVRRGSGDARPERKLSGASAASASTCASEGRVRDPLDLPRMGEPPALTHDQQAFLASLNLPSGLAQEIVNSHAAFPLRIWILDNSGSMTTRDGHRPAASGIGLEACSRWEELGASLAWHARVSAFLGAPTEFRLLNSMEDGPRGIPAAPACVRCGFGSGDPMQEVAEVQRLAQCEPRGRGTPLCRRIQEATQRIASLAPQLRACGQRASLVICSDGAATDGDVAQALRPLRELPVWVVVRLCTDDDKVLDYWNNVDEELELDMDVLDDLKGEAAEVHEHNPWLTYGQPLHWVRERGAQSKLFDLIDEKPLTLTEVHAMAELVFGCRLPHPEADWTGFQRALAEHNRAAPSVRDPLKSKQRDEWIRVKKVRKIRGQSCAIM